MSIEERIRSLIRKTVSEEMYPNHKGDITVDTVVSEHGEPFVTRYIVQIHARLINHVFLVKIHNNTMEFTEFVKSPWPFGKCRIQNVAAELAIES